MLTALLDSWLTLVMRLLLILITVYSSLTQAQEERIILKGTKTKPVIIPNVGIGEATEEKDFMPGNNDYGFFVRKNSDKNGICRLRMKVTCDYGFGSTKSLKLKDMQLNLKDSYYKGRTDDQGVIDFLFKCNPHISKMKAKLIIGSFNQEFILESAQKELLINDKQCK